MFGAKRTIPFWRQRRRLLTLERALAGERTDDARGVMTAQALAHRRARGRVTAEGRRKARFSEG